MSVESPEISYVVKFDNSVLFKFKTVPVDNDLVAIKIPTPPKVDPAEFCDTCRGTGKICDCTCEFDDECDCDDTYMIHCYLCDMDYESTGNCNC